MVLKHDAHFGHAHFEHAQFEHAALHRNEVAISGWVVFCVRYTQPLKKNHALGIYDTHTSLKICYTFVVGADDR
jgi:hypothetical protein